MTVPKIVFVESELNTVHPGGHERAGKRIRTYARLALDRIDENGRPIYHYVTRFEEDISEATSAKMMSPPGRPRRKRSP